MTDPVVSFLIRHPALTSVHLKTLHGPRTPRRILLSNLQQFHGPVFLIPQIAATNLSEVELTWYPGNQHHDVEPTFVALRSMTCNDIPFACSIYYNPSSDLQFIDIVDSISRNLPQTQLLRIRLRGIRFREEKLAHLKSYLARFTGLAFLSVEELLLSIEWNFGSPFWQNEAEDLKTVREIGNLCSTLEACCLGAHGWRKVDGRWEKCTIREFRALAGIHTQSNECLDFE
ncbi:hypothetical protein B0H11DRAFT_2286195 [Mycena galericulata]|nr:hypothetical protein B0H11DRAFT_2286195 [Mycena galericulata]